MKRLITIFLIALITMSGCAGPQVMKHGGHKHKKHVVARAKPKAARVKKPLTPNQIRALVVMGMLTIMTLDGAFDKQPQR